MLLPPPLPEEPPALVTCFPDLANVQATLPEAATVSVTVPFFCVE